MSETLDTMLAAMPAGYQKTVGFPTYDILAAASIPMEELEQELGKTRRMLDPAFLTGADLDSYIRSRSGLVRNAATYASGVLQVTGTGTIMTGDLFESGGGTQFAAIETVAIRDRGQVSVRCTQAGAIGNLPAGSITLMPVQIAGIVTVSNSDTMTGGYDAETDGAYFETDPSAPADAADQREPVPLSQLGFGGVWGRRRASLSVRTRAQYCGCGDHRCGRKAGKYGAGGSCPGAY